MDNHYAVKLTGPRIRVIFRIERVAFQMSSYLTLPLWMLMRYTKEYPENRSKLAAELRRRRAKRPES